jgi:outer membrane beta-barrel protein
MRAKATAFVIAVVLALPVVSAAQEAEDPGKLAAVQKRKFRMDHEIFAAAGLQPLDAFYKGLGPLGGYTLHFSDTVAWELVRGGYAFILHTGLHDQLNKDFGVQETKFDEMEWMVSTAAMLTPFYGKLSFLNSSVLHTELFVVLGATVGKFKDTYKPGPQAGAGLRFFLSEHWSIRLDVRYHYLFNTQQISKSTQVVDIALGLALSLGGTD